MSNEIVNTKQNYKFALGGIFAIATGLIIGILALVNAGMSIIGRIAGLLGVFPYLFQNPMNLVSHLFGFLTDRETVEAIGHLICFVALTVFGILLIAKQRKKLLVFFPIAGIVANIISLSGHVLPCIQGAILGGFPSLIRTLPAAAIAITADAIIIAAYVVLAVVILTNCGSDQKKLPFLMWVAPAAVAVGYLILSVSVIAGKIASLLSIFYSATLVSVIMNLFDISLIIYIVAFVLYALTFFFAASWIINPYKKVKATEAVEE